MELAGIQWFYLALAAFFVGFSKTGISGALIPIVALLAITLGGMSSTGLLLPMLLLGDFFAVYYYKSYADFEAIKKLFPWIFIGISMGAALGIYISDGSFKRIITLSIVCCLGAGIYLDIKKEGVNLYGKPWLYRIAGILTGFTSMMGNAAGPVFTVYLFALGYKKQDFMGTTAWTFLVINITKLFFQLIFWHNITPTTLRINSVLIPFIVIGAVIGALVVKKLREKTFHNIVMAVTIAAVIGMII